MLGLSGSVWAYDFSAVAPSGQTLYYNIVNGNAEVTSQSGFSPYYNTYPTGNLVIPSSVTNGSNTYNVTSIGYAAFYNCSGLTSVTIGNSVTNIGDGAFAYCSGLLNVVCKSVYPPTAQSNTFYGIPAYCTLTVPCGSLTYYNVTEPWSSKFQIKNEDCREEYTVTVVSADPTMGSAYVNGEATATVLDGDEATLTATANASYRFVRWNDDNTDSVRTVTVTADTTFTAYFESTTQGISATDAGETTIYAVDGRIVVNGAEGEPVSVYDVVGREVFHAAQTGETPALPGGFYLVKVGALPARKVVVLK